MTDLNVIVFRRVDSNTGKPRKFFEAQWTDPVTGKRKTRSTRKSTKSEAQKAAAVIEHELRTGKYKPPARITWEEFCRRYVAEVLPSQARKTANLTHTVFNSIDRIITPKLLIALNARQISKYQSALRDEDCADATIKCYLRQLKVALRWAESQGMLHEVPEIKMPKARGMKGRPITAEEFDRMLSKIETGLLNVKRSTRNQTRKQRGSVDAETVDSWRHLLHGLWWSGLRLGEALKLHWTEDRELYVDLSKERPAIVIRGHAQKSGKDERLSIAPEFAEFLLQTPEEYRTGYVFNPIPRKKQAGRIKLEWASAVISAIGREAGVKVAENGKGKVKFASAHDLRRAFGTRWSARVKPLTLQKMMRHADIKTTLEFYVAEDEREHEDAIWGGFTNEFANSTPETKNATPLPTSQSVEPQEVSQLPG